MPPSSTEHHSDRNKNTPPIRPSSPGLLSADFARQQISKQQRNNYHSSSLRTMVSNSVNKTALHPSGVQYVFLPLVWTCRCALERLLVAVQLLQSN